MMLVQTDEYLILSSYSHYRRRFSDSHFWVKAVLSDNYIRKGEFVLKT